MIWAASSQAALVACMYTIAGGDAASYVQQYAAAQAAQRRAPPQLTKRTAEGSPSASPLAAEALLALGVEPGAQYPQYTPGGMRSGLKQPRNLAYGPPMDVESEL